MPANDDLLQKILSIEELPHLKATLLNKKVEITSTETLAIPIEPKEGAVEKRFRPVTIKVIVIMVLISFTIPFILQSTRKTEVNIWPAVLILALIAAGTIHQAFFSKKLNHNILISHDGISISNDFFNWDNVYDTAILHLPLGKNGTYYLVIILKNEVYYKYDLSNFYGYRFKEKLAGYLQYFRGHLPTTSVHSHPV